MSSHQQSPSSFFSYAGSIQISKSLLNRWLILQSYLPLDSEQLDPKFKHYLTTGVMPLSSSNDVQFLWNAIKKIYQGQTQGLYCGLAGTTFRFLVLLLGRLPGQHTLLVAPELYRRPQAGIYSLLDQLGVSYSWQQTTDESGAVLYAFELNTRAATYPSVLSVDQSISSQFYSALLLNSWNWPCTLKVTHLSPSFGQGLVSESYGRMTLQLVQFYGLNWRTLDSSESEIDIEILPLQSVKLPHPPIAWEHQADVSSVWAIVAIAAVSGECLIGNFPENDWQPDVFFIEILRRLGYQLRRRSHFLYLAPVVLFENQLSPLGLHFSLRQAPDLFPVLAAFIALRSDGAILNDAPQLVAKESNRLQSVSRLLSLVGRKHRILEGQGIELFALEGGQKIIFDERPIAYDPEGDHRLHMAAQVLIAAGANLVITDVMAVKKSFANFEQVLEQGEKKSQAAFKVITSQAFIGHRGAGKTTLLWSHFFAQSVPPLGLMRSQQKVWGFCYSPLISSLTLWIDWDALLEDIYGISLTNWFEERGEADFRTAELTCWQEFEQYWWHCHDVEELNPLAKTALWNEFKQLCGQHQQQLSIKLQVALGAGFPLSEVSAVWELCWVRRRSDAQGRIFLDRPALQQGVIGVADYFSRFEQRDQLFSRYADRQLELPEGHQHHQLLPLELKILEDQWKLEAPAAVTLLPEHRHHPAGPYACLHRYLLRGSFFIELRDDYFSEDELRALWEFTSRLGLTHRLILSHRRSPLNKYTWATHWGAIDVDLSLIDPHQETESIIKMLQALQIYTKQIILSAHEETTALFDQYHFLCTPDRWLKWAPLIATFDQLWQGHTWATVDSSQRSFLPRSQQGRWSWYRLVTKNLFPLSFVRESAQGSQVDQPSLWQWLSTPPYLCKTKWAAVLGSPVALSYSPMQHRDFFLAQQSALFAVELSAAEWNQQPLNYLQQLGMHWAAVTSPLKKLILPLAVNNTLMLADPENNKWSYTNTDAAALLRFVDDVLSQNQSVLAALHVIVGRGAMGQQLKQLLPQAQQISSDLLSDLQPIPGPWILWWASGYSSSPITKDLYRGFTPLCIVDCNYLEHSPGRAIALATQSKYISGINLFQWQAQAQQVFWRSPGGALV